MKIDTGLGVVIIAVLIFYLRLIGLQRERVKRVAAASQVSQKGKKKRQSPTGRPLPQYSILSPRRRDRIIAGFGVALIVAGVLLYLNILPFPFMQSYWWIPTSIGIVAFSWAFQV